MDKKQNLIEIEKTSKIKKYSSFAMSIVKSYLFFSI